MLTLIGKHKNTLKGYRRHETDTRLKAENTLEWIGRMNNIRVCAREIVNEKILYA